MSRGLGGSSDKTYYSMAQKIPPLVQFLKIQVMKKKYFQVIVSAT